MAHNKPKRYSLRSHNQIKHSPEIQKEEIIKIPDPSPPIPSILFRPSTPTQDVDAKEDDSVSKHFTNIDTAPPHQLTFSNGDRKCGFKVSKSVFRSLSDRTSDRQAYISAIRQRNSLKYESREQFMHSPSHKSVSSNSISNLSESDGSLLSSSTSRSQDSPSSVLPATETCSIETNSTSDKNSEQWRGNEHILFNDPLISWSESVSPSRLTDMRKNEIHRQDLIWELIYTERTHVRKLKVMLYLFKEPLLKMPKIVSEFKVNNQLFPRLETIIDIHVTLLNSLLERQQCSVEGDLKICDILTDWFSGDSAESIKSNHTEYSLNSESAAATFNTWRHGKDPPKHDFITTAEQDDCCRRLRIDQLLAIVWQRMTRYHILIENIISTYKDEECEEVRNLQKALTECNLTVGAIDSAVNEKRNNEALLSYQEKFDLTLSDKISPRFSLNSLVENNRKLLYHGTLNWKVGKNKSIEVHALLLSDLLVLMEYDESKLKYYLKCHTGKGQENIWPAISLSDLIYRHQALDKVSFFVCTFDLGQTPRMYEFSTQSRTERDYWEMNINKAVGNFADRNQKLKQNEQDRVEFIKQYKERPTRKESANRSSSTPQPPVTAVENRPNVICSNSQPLEELNDHEDLEIMCEVSSPCHEQILENIPEAMFSVSEEESMPYYREKKRLSTVFRERIPAYIDPSTYAPPIENNETSPSPGVERKLSHDDKKSAWFRGFRASSSQGMNDDIYRPRSISDKDYMTTSLRDASKSSTDLNHSLSLKKSPRVSAPIVTKHPLFKTEMCPISNYDQSLFVPQSGMSSFLNKSESSLIDKPKEERRSIGSMFNFKGLKRKSSKQMKESEYVSQSLPRRSSHVSLTPNLERRNRQSDLDMPAVESDVILTPPHYSSPNHSPLQRTSYPYRGMSQDKSVSLDSLDNLTPTFKQLN